MPGRILAISDLHVAHPQNREIVAELRPGGDEDWLLVAGDVGELSADIDWVLGLLARRFAKVIWTPGNHELWTHPRDPLQLRGERRYAHLVEVCRGHGVLTPEDPYPVWTGPGGPVVVAPLFLLYDYSFRPAGTATKEEALARAIDAGVLCRDEQFLHPEPFASIDAWCESRLAVTERRLAALDPALPTILVNHFPLNRDPLHVLWYPEFSVWCGTERTGDWHRRFRARAVVYGHLHIPRTITRDGVPFVEVSVGYPREWGRRPPRDGWLRQILPGTD